MECINEFYAWCKPGRSRQDQMTARHSLRSVFLFPPCFRGLRGGVTVAVAA